VRLDPLFRCAIYVAVGALFASGVAWLVADPLKDGPNGEVWQAVTAELLMVHGGLAMVILLLLGALFPVHVRGGWRKRTNRITGTTMVTLNAVLIVTAFGLYYAGSDVLRPWMSDVHLGFGLALPVLLLAHIVVGRRNRNLGR